MSEHDSPPPPRPCPAAACAVYVFQLFPRLGWYLLKAAGPKRAAALKSGGDGYAVGSLLGLVGEHKAGAGK